MCSPHALLLLIALSSLLGCAFVTGVRSRCPDQPVDAFVGVHTAPYARYRRDTLRKTWFPPHQEALDQLTVQSSVVMRWIIGYSIDPDEEKSLTEETQQFGGFWRLQHKESYGSLTRKTMMMFYTVAHRCQAAYIIKVDDDVYLRPTAVPLAVRQWQTMGKDYIGCFFRDNIIIRNQTGEYPQWYEPQHLLLGQTYHAYARGPAYALSEKAAAWLTSMPPGSHRYFRSEDVTVGSAMLALNVTFFDDVRMCTLDCSVGVVVYNGSYQSCNGLCNVMEDAVQLHANSSCSKPMSTADDLPLLPPRYAFLTAEEATATALNDDGKQHPEWEQEPQKGSGGEQAPSTDQPQAVGTQMQQQQPIAEQAQLAAQPTTIATQGAANLQQLVVTPTEQPAQVVVPQHGAIPVAGEPKQVVVPQQPGAKPVSEHVSHPVPQQAVQQVPLASQAASIPVADAATVAQQQPQQPLMPTTAQAAHNV